MMRRHTNCWYLSIYLFLATSACVLFLRLYSPLPLFFFVCLSHYRLSVCLSLYIYIYIYCHPQTDILLYQNSSMWQYTWDAPSRDWNSLNFTSGWWHTPTPSLRLNVIRELTQTYQVSFVYILRYRLLKCSIC